jgi:hypothetical protein
MIYEGYTELCQLINEWPSTSTWNLGMLIFVEGGILENPEKNPRSKGENQQQTPLK